MGYVFILQSHSSDFNDLRDRALHHHVLHAHALPTDVSNPNDQYLTNEKRRIKVN